MLALVYGGAASGKSEYAEHLAVGLAQGTLPLFYLATLAPTDDECRQKINRHRGMRAGKPFLTLECPQSLSRLHLPMRGVVLLECLSTLTANELFSAQGVHPEAGIEIRAGIKNLLRQSEHLVVVSNSLFEDGISYDSFTQNYLKILGGLHQYLARHAELVAEVVAGIPVIGKDTRKEGRLCNPGNP